MHKEITNSVKIRNYKDKIRAQVDTQTTKGAVKIEEVTSHTAGEHVE